MLLDQTSYYPIVIQFHDVNIATSLGRRAGLGVTFLAHVTFLALSSLPPTTYSYAALCESAAWRDNHGNAASAGWSGRLFNLSRFSGRECATATASRRGGIDAGSSIFEPDNEGANVFARIRIICTIAIITSALAACSDDARDPHTVVSTKPSPDGQTIAEVLRWNPGPDSHTYDYVVIRRAPPDGTILLTKDFSSNPGSLIFDWKDNSHLEINGVEREPAYKFGRPTRAGNIEISYSDFGGAAYDRKIMEDKEQIIQSAPEKSVISPDRLSASFSEVFETTSPEPPIGPTPPNRCILSIEAEDGKVFDRIGIIIKGNRWRDQKHWSLDNSLHSFEFWLGARIDHAYQPSIFDAFTMDIASGPARGTGENQLHAIAVFGPGDATRKMVPFLRYQPIPVVYRTGLNKQLYFYELHTEKIHDSLDRYSECIGYNWRTSTP